MSWYTDRMKKVGQTTLYRKYRPQSFTEIVGQEHVISVLTGALGKDTVSHAYLFAGSRGTGKTSIARIFAKEAGTSDKDLYEIDAASNRGIDDIRELREGVTVLPFESKYKVYIIDEVHMLTKEAFNAFLKTLEEPPKHAVFILATTEIDKLPETIVSRCEVHTFRKPSVSMLKEMIVSISKKEGYILEQSSADLIATLAEGSFRDALGILQKIIIASNDKKISLAEVEEVTGAPCGKLINTVIQSIDEKNLSMGFRAISDASEQNIDMRVFLKLILRKLRTVLLLRYATDLEDTLKKEYSEEDFLYLKNISGKKDNNINSKTLTRFLDAYEEVKHSYVRELPLELALIDLIKG